MRGRLTEGNLAFFNAIFFSSMFLLNGKTKFNIIDWFWLETNTLIMNHRNTEVSVVFVAGLKLATKVDDKKGKKRIYRSMAVFWLYINLILDWFFW